MGIVRTKVMALDVSSALSSFPMWARYAHHQLWETAGPCCHRASCSTLPINLFFLFVCMSKKPNTTYSILHGLEIPLRTTAGIHYAQIPQCLCTVACMKDITKKLSSTLSMCSATRFLKFFSGFIWIYLPHIGCHL